MTINPQNDPARKRLDAETVKAAIHGYELQILQMLGVPWKGGKKHIDCPLPGHGGAMDWRWDSRQRRWHCSCGHGDIFDLICRLRDVSFPEALAIAANLAGIPTPCAIEPQPKPARGRTKTKRQQSRPSGFAGIAVLSPGESIRDDSLVSRYLGYRLGVEPDEVVLPSTPIAGHREAPYWHGGNDYEPPAKLGMFPMLAFSLIDRDGKVHATRTYVAQDGHGKADIRDPDTGDALTVKKLLQAAEGDNTSGRSAIFGQTSAPCWVISEGIETAAAIAYVFKAEIEAGTMAIAAAGNAGGVEAFKPWPATTRIIIAADRDERASEPGKAPSRRGEQAASKFCMEHRGDDIELAIAIPGKPDTKTDWLDVLVSESIEAVRSGIRNADPFQPSDKTAAPDDQAVTAWIVELAKLPLLSYERQRQFKAKVLGLRTSILDKLVDEHREASERADPSRGQAMLLPDFESWGSEVDGADLIEAMVRHLQSFVSMDEPYAIATALWAIATHAHDAFYHSPRLLITAPTKRAGKSTLARCVGRLVPRRVSVSNITSAALFRTIALHQPTLILDEADTFLNESEDLRGIINGGHSREDAFVVRTVEVNGDHEPRMFNTWAPMVISGIGKPADTIVDRSIVITLQRKVSGAFKRLRGDRDQGFEDLGRQAKRWVQDHYEELEASDPTTPDGLNDRAADNWRSLLAIADLAGGEWPERSRQAALAISSHDEEDSASVMLLTDIRAAFDDADIDKLSSQDLVDRLVQMEGRPWPDWGRGKGLSKSSLARLVKPFKISPSTVRVAGETPKGYRRKQFHDVWARYLPNDIGGQDAGSASNPSDETPHRHKPMAVGERGGSSNATSPQMLRFENAEKPSDSEGCGAVADQYTGTADTARSDRVNEKPDSIRHDPESQGWSTTI